MRDNNAWGSQAEDLVAHCARTIGEYDKADGKTPYIDGHLQIADPKTGQIYSVLIQVKSGRSKFSKRESRKRVVGRLDPDHVKAWKRWNLLIIVVWVEDAGNRASQMLWADAARAKRSGRLDFLASSEFGASAAAPILRLARAHAGCPDVPLLSHDLLFPEKVSEVRALAKNWFRMWMRVGSYSPVFGPVEVSWRVWRHITRCQLGQATVLHRLSLLPLAKEALEAARDANRVRTIGDGTGARYLFVVSAIYRRPHRTDAVIEVVVESTHKQGRPGKCKLVSLYERKRRA